MTPAAIVRLFQARALDLHIRVIRPTPARS